MRCIVDKKSEVLMERSIHDDIKDECLVLRLLMIPRILVDGIFEGPP